jgi:iron complex outermembrane receptor protein
MTCHLRRRLVATTILAALCAPAAAFAQAAPLTTAPAAATDQLEEVVVTAQHVTENLQKAAISATVSTGENLITRGINDTAALARLVPGLQITPNNGYTNFNIRGITSGGANSFSDSAVAVNYNQVSLAFPSSASGLYFDLERVELLNGPQGILYGRNATAGAVNVIARKPTLGGRYDGNVGLDYGNYDQINGRFALNVPVSEKVAVRLAAQTVNHGGYWSDGASNQHDNAVRISLLAEPNEDLSLYVSADYAKSDNKGAGVTLSRICGTDPNQTGTAANVYCFIGRSPRTGLEDLSAFLPDPRPSSFVDSYWWGVMGTLEYKTPIGVLSVIPAYRRTSAHTMANNAGFGSLKQFDDPSQKSVEVRLQSPQDQRIRYQFGVYGLRAPMHGAGGSETPGSATGAGRTWSDSFYDLNTKSNAAFGQLTFALTDKIRLVGGLRYTKDTKSSNSTRYTLNNTFGTQANIPETLAGAQALPTSQAAANGGQWTTLIVAGQQVEKSWAKTTYKAGIEWDVAPNSFAYVDVRSGFKSGGFFFAPQPGGVTANGIGSFNPETIVAYSAGSKNRFFDNKLQVNIEAFLYDYKNQQLATNLQLPSGQLIAITENIGHVKIKGAEIAADWLPLENTRLGFNVQWADGNYDSLLTLSPTGKTGNNATSACAVTQLHGPPVDTQANLFQFDCSGLGFVNLSKWSYNLDAQQTLPLSNGAAFVAEANFRFQSARNSSLTFVAGSRTPASSFLDANIRYRAASGKWDLTAFVNNAVNNQRVVNAAPQAGNPRTVAANNVSFTTITAPRTYGIRANYYY